MLRDLGSTMRFRGRILLVGAQDATHQRDARAFARAIAAAIAPRRWPPARRHRAVVLDRMVSAGSLGAARRVLRDLATDPAARRPGHEQALRRAAAMIVVAASKPVSDRAVDLAIVAYLRGESGPHRPPAPSSDEVAATARAKAEAMRAVVARPVVIVVAYPGFEANPYGRLMALAFAEHGLVEVPVDTPDAIDAIVAGHDPADRVAIHCNAPERFVTRVASDEEAVALAGAVARRLDGWLAAGAMIIASLHNGARLTGSRAVAERLIAQAIIDRARFVHVLSASTPDLLRDWVDLRRATVVHVPHPNYDRAYEPGPDRDAARRDLGLRPATEPGGDIVVGLLGALADRKGGVDLLEAVAKVPDPLPDGRRLRLVIGGVLIGAHSEDVIRLAGADARVIARFGFLDDDVLRSLLASLDVAVIPYGRYLNSGWMHLALGAGIPIIAPRGGTADEIALDAARRRYDPTDPASLVEALTEAGSLVTAEARQAARASVADLDAERLSAAFAAAVLAAVAADETQPALVAQLPG